MFILSNDMVMAKFPRGQTYLLNVCLLMTIPFRHRTLYVQAKVGILPADTTKIKKAGPERKFRYWD